MFDPTKLRWAPPAQTDPTTHNVAVGNSVVTFGDDEDVILVMPATAKVTQSQFIGGRHLRMIGGRHTATTSGGSLSLSFQGQTGSVFVEGVSFDNTAQPLRDALWFGGSSDPLRQPSIYVQNCTMRGITGEGPGIHGDAIQIADSTMGNVRIDCVDVQHGYQGFMCIPNDATYERPLVDISRCTLSNVEEGGFYSMLFYTNATEAGRWPAASIRLRDVWTDSRGTYNVPATLPNTSAAVGVRPVAGPVPSSWQLLNARGYLIESDRTPFTIGTPGLSYTSPGYNDPDDQPVFVPVSVDGGGMKPRLLHHFLTAQPDGVYTFPAAGGAVSMTWSEGACSYDGTITVPVEKLTGGQGPLSLTFADGLLTGTA